MEHFINKENIVGETKEHSFNIELTEIKALEKPMINILDQMREKIDTRQYDSILGDDASGRIPTLILSRAIKNIYKKRGQEKIPAFFVAAGGSGSDPTFFSEVGGPPGDSGVYEERLAAIEKYVGEIKEELGKRALVVTDFIDTGATIANLGRILKKQNIKFDVASIAVTSKFSRGDLPSDSRLFAGGKERWISGLFSVFFQPKIYGKSRLSGLMTSKVLKENEVFAKPYKFLNKKDREKFLQSRRDSYRLADKLTEHYFKNEFEREISEKELLPLPKRKDFKTFDEYDKAYLEFQKSRLKFLAQKYPNAFYRGAVWHGTHLPLEEVFQNGLPSRESDNFDLEEHQFQFVDVERGKKDYSAFRGSSEDARVPATFARTGYYVYKLFPYGGGIVLDTALGEKLKVENLLVAKNKGLLRPEEKEIVIGSRQPAFIVEGCRRVGDWSEAMEAYRLEEFVKNPNFKIANIREFDH